jgi:hypothetical protein
MMVGTTYIKGRLAVFGFFRSSRAQMKAAEAPQPETRHMLAPKDWWHVKDGEIVRPYECEESFSPNGKTSLQIKCWFQRELTGRVHTGLDFILDPYVYFMPGQKPLPDNIITPPFVVGLFAAGNGGGTEADPVMRGGMFKVTAYSKGSAARLSVDLTTDISRAVATIAMGEILTFSIYELAAEPPIKLKLSLPNDREFARLYDQVRSKI